MTLAEANPAAREATAAVAMVERAPYRRRDRARTRADFDDTAVTAVLHYHAARVARDAPRRFCRNARKRTAASTSSRTEDIRVVPVEQRRIWACSTRPRQGVLDRR